MTMRKRRFAVAGLVSRNGLPRRTAKRLLFNLAAAMRAFGLEPVRRKGRLIDPRTGETVASIEQARSVWGRAEKQAREQS